MVAIVLAVVLIAYYELRGALPWSDATALEDLDAGRFIIHQEPEAPERPPEFRTPPREEPRR